MRSKKLNEAELKKIAQNLLQQEQEVENLLQPKRLIEQTEIDEVKKFLDE
jgi:hypothetical protein